MTLISSDPRRPTTAKSTPPVCYLCGKVLADTVTSDHVPPRQLFAAELRKKHGLTQLLTIPAHRACNEAYKIDEQYFLHSLAPFAAGSYSGRPILEKVGREYREGLHRPLVDTVLREFDPRPSGLVLPGGKVAKRFQGDRIHRVAWKIVRGLAFHHFGEIHPESLTVNVTVTAPGETPPEHFIKLNVDNVWTDLGPYQGIFAYRYLKSNAGQYWALLLWNAVIITVMFHGNDCRCPVCINSDGAPQLAAATGN